MLSHIFSFLFGIVTSAGFLLRRSKNAKQDAYALELFKTLAASELEFSKNAVTVLSTINGVLLTVYVVGLTGFRAWDALNTLFRTTDFPYGPAQAVIIAPLPLFLLSLYFLTIAPAFQGSALAAPGGWTNASNLASIKQRYTVTADKRRKQLRLPAILTSLGTLMLVLGAFLLYLASNLAR
jgi:hypothetical protein